jgi:ATP-dependent DNA helicase RecG
MARRLRRLGVDSVRDLLFHLPRRYDDFTRPASLRSLREAPVDGPVSATVEIVSLDVAPTYRRRVQKTVARLRDATGEGEAIWFGRRFIERRLKPGDSVVLSGKVELRGWLPQFQNPEFGLASGELLNAGRIVPVYRLTAGVTAAWLRRAVRAALDRFGAGYEEYLPPTLLAAAGDEPMAIAEALEAAHYPPDFAARDRALTRLAFDELLALQVGMVARDRQRRGLVGLPVPVPDERFRSSVEAIEAVITARIRSRTEAGTYEARLTPDQSAALTAIRVDLAGPRPMLRLLQGDVGSGKTAIAALAMAFVADAGHQAALLAPTDLLARQHAQTLAELLEPLGHGVTLLTGSLATAARREALELVAAPVDRTTTGASAGRIVIGTHALVQDVVAFADLALAVIDEQHRFGVAQREALAAKGRSPHVLLMTATPIPQTLGRVLHADLDVSDLRTPPQGRQEIGTGIRRSDQLMSAGGDPARGTYPLLVGEVGKGHRAFVVVPLVEEDEASGARSAEATAEQLRTVLPEVAARLGRSDARLEIGVVHGQLKAAQRDAEMERFRQGELTVLVGTTVLEVGVDVPEATVMVILDADRFGVAQLHQLRGRVGRGEARSYCVLVSDSEDEVAQARLKAVEATQDGFVLAEEDLRLRREGELLGLTQSGLPPLRVASLHDRRHQALSKVARSLAESIVDEAGQLDPTLEGFARELTTGWLARVGAGEALAPEEAGAGGEGEPAAPEPAIGIDA